MLARETRGRTTSRNDPCAVLGAGASSAVRKVPKRQMTGSGRPIEPRVSRVRVFLRNAFLKMRGRNFIRLPGLRIEPSRLRSPTHDQGAGNMDEVNDASSE